MTKKQTVYFFNDFVEDFIYFRLFQFSTLAPQQKFNDYNFFEEKPPTLQTDMPLTKTELSQKLSQSISF